MASRVTQSILQYAPGSRRDGDDRHRLVASIQSFITMYRPHAAREQSIGINDLAQFTPR